MTLDRHQLGAIVKPLLSQPGKGLHAAARIIDQSSPYTFGHSERVAQYAMAFGRERQVPRDVLQRIWSAGLLHDLGMVLCPSEIRDKQAGLDQDEFDVIRRHPVDGADLLAAIPAMDAVTRIVRHHHERHDGSGYPAGLPVDEIPLESRFLGLADAYDAMVSNRPHRFPLSIEAALVEIDDGAGQQFDPELAAAFTAMIRARWSQRMMRLGAETMFAEISLRSKELALVDLQQRHPGADQWELAERLQHEFPEVGPEQAARLVDNLVKPGEVPDDLYGDEYSWVKDNEIEVIYPARIDADINSLVRYAGKLYVVLDIGALDDGRFRYLLKR